MFTIDKANTKLSKKDLAYLNIKNSIISNEFTSETPLTENFLCNKYGFSRTPVREALHRLTTEDFVSFIKDKGFFITDIGLDDLLQIYEMREALEGMAARLCAIRVTEATLIELEDLLSKSIACFKKGNTSQSMAHDMQFHRCLVHASNNTRLGNTINSLIETSSRIVLKADNAIITQSLEDHQKVFEAIKNSDADLAETFMRQHISNSKKYHFSKYYFDT